MIPNNQSRYSGFKRLSSRAVLSKGLEFDCVIINLAEKFTATEMYVAMTRAMKAIYFITDKDYVMLDAPQESFFGHMKDEIDVMGCKVFWEVRAVIDEPFSKMSLTWGTL